LAKRVPWLTRWVSLSALVVGILGDAIDDELGDLLALLGVRMADIASSS